MAFDSAHALPACLDALRVAGVPAIVVDNASGDDGAAVAERHGAKVLRNARNEGYGRANNAGIRAARVVVTTLPTRVNKPDWEYPGRRRPRPARRTGP